MEMNGQDNKYNQNGYSGQTQVYNEQTIISEGTKITGNIELAGDLVLDGAITGNINCNQRLCIRGIVEGNIESCDLEAEDSTIKGDINCSGDMLIHEGATITGDCKTGNIVCGGRIKGNVYVQESVKLEEKAAVIGDISAMDIEINRGAIIQGKLDIRQEVFIENED